MDIRKKPKKEKLYLQPGSTWDYIFRPSSGPFIYRKITNIAQEAPCRLTVPGHGIPERWPCAITGVQGPTILNARNDPPDPQVDFRRVSVIDESTVDLIDVNGAAYPKYIAGGYIQYFTPIDLAGYKVRMQLRDDTTDALLWEATEANGKVVIDNIEKRITITIGAAESSAFTWTQSKFSIEMESPQGRVRQVSYGTLEKLTEHTR